VNRHQNDRHQVRRLKAWIPLEIQECGANISHKRLT
jgi:hypothetical protein